MLSVILVFSGTIVVLILALIQMTVVYKKEMGVAAAVVKMLSFQLEASEKHRINTDKMLLEKSMRLAMCEKWNEKLRDEKLKAWGIIK